MKTAQRTVLAVALFGGGTVHARAPGETQPPEYGAMRERPLAGDLAAAGAVLGAIVIPMRLSVAPWADYASVTKDSVIDSPAGREEARRLILNAELVGIGAGSALAVTGWMVGGGYKTGRWERALLGGLAGSVVGGAVGTGVGLLTHRPWTGRQVNASGEQEWVLGYTIGMLTLATFTAAGTTAGVILAGGKVEGKRKKEVQLVMQTQVDESGAAVPTPTLRRTF